MLIWQQDPLSKMEVTENLGIDFKTEPTETDQENMRYATFNYGKF